MKCSILLSGTFALSFLLLSCKTHNEPAPIPVFTSFTPAKGPAGSTITVLGKSFSSNATDNVVTLGTTVATVLTATADQLTISVPAATTGGKISIVVRGITLQSSSDFTVTDRWERMADVGGKRDFGFSFTANGKGYVGAGSLSQTDFWEYDPASNVWTQKQDFKGVPRVYSTAFGVGSKGYVTCGLGGSSAQKDVWQYDPSSNDWTRKNDLPFTERFGAVGFAIGSKGYVGTGILGTTDLSKDFWEYDPATDVWTKKADMPGDARTYAFGLAVGMKGYIGGGITRPGDVPLKTFFEYDPTLDLWTPKANSPEGTDVSFFSNSFASASKGYVSGATGNQLWQFDPTANTWTRKADPITQIAGIGFTIGEYGFMGASYDKNFYRYFFE